MKILLVLPKINSECQWNVGLAYISAVLKNYGHQVKLFEMSDYKKDLEPVLNIIGDYQPGIIGATANSHQFRYVKALARDIKKNFSIPFFVGGVHVILKPQSIEEETNIDGICLGEGELPFLELVERLAAGKSYLDVKNFWFRNDDSIIKNDLRPLIENLDSLSLPDRSIFSYFSGSGPKTPRFIFSRGCPFECTYCCNHAFKKIYQGLGAYVRWRSVDLALREIELLKEQYDFDYFKLDDDTFSLNRIWLKEFCQKLIAKNWQLSFECNIRPGVIDEESMRLLKQAGCRMVKIGVEAGNAELRKKVLNRFFSNEDIMKTFALAKKFGVLTFSFNMIGVPGETLATIADTIKLNQEIQPDFMQVTAFYPYPLTALGDLCFVKGYVDKNYEDSYMEKSVLNLPTVSRRQIERAVKNFKFNVYWGYNKKKALKEKLAQVRKFVISQPQLYHLVKIIYKPIKLLKK